MIDFHSHILPELDDGAKSPEASSEMLRASYLQGVKKIVATPHFYAENDNPEEFFERRSESAKKLIEVYDAGSMPVVYLGAEVAYFPGISHSDVPGKMCIVGTNYMLLEMPEERWSDNTVEEVFKIKRYGVTPIIAHIERCIFEQSKDTLGELLRNGIVLQANAESFTRFRLKRKMIKLIENDGIQIIGTDAHDTENRPPNMEKAYDVLLDRCDAFVIKKLESISKMILTEATPINEII